VGPSEVADDGQDHHGGQVFGPEDRLDVLLHLSDVAVVPGVDDCVHSEHILIREAFQFGRLYIINRAAHFAHCLSFCFLCCCFCYCEAKRGTN